MSDNQLNKDAFKEAQQTFSDKRKEFVKGYILKTLENKEIWKAKKAEADEALRIIGMDLDDLKEGKFDNIQERQRKSSFAQRVSIPIQPVISIFSDSSSASTPMYPQANWTLAATWFSGTYPTATRVYYL